MSRPRSRHPLRRVGSRRRSSGAWAGGGLKDRDEQGGQTVAVRPVKEPFVGVLTVTGKEVICPNDHGLLADMPGRGRRRPAVDDGDGDRPDLQSAAGAARRLGVVRGPHEGPEDVSMTPPGLARPKGGGFSGGRRTVQALPGSQTALTLTPPHSDRPKSRSWAWRTTSREEDECPRGL